jgi:glucose/arabinose dehydrogenase
VSLPCRPAWLAAAAIAAAAAGCGGGAADTPDASTSTNAPAPATSTPATTPAQTTTTGTSSSTELGTPQVVASGLQVPWGLAWLPDGDALVSERTTGRILRIPKAGGKPVVAATLPEVSKDIGEGGLLGIAVSPDYATDKLVYAYFTGAQDNRVVRFRLGSDPKPIITGIYRSTNHDGGRIAFGPDGKLWITTGDGLQGSRAQDPKNPGGKILRIDPDGSIPADNPTKGSPVWSLGHRNVQGLAWDDQGRLWATEFGENTFDEVNLIRKGGNYGWPEVEGKGDTQGGRFINPQVTWPTSEASPSGAAYARGTLWVGALRGQRLWKVPLDGATAGTPTALLENEFGRIRTVAVAPDGALWITTSNRDGRGDPSAADDRVIRIPFR